MDSNFNSSSNNNNIIDNPNQTVYRADVIVVGSGIAGISAARRLFESGQNVLVLEARPDRMGGRICKSGVFHDLHVDLGASWLHTIQENPLLDYALKIKVEMSLTKNPYLTSSHKFQLFDHDGRAVSDEEQVPVRAKYDLVFSEIAKHLKTLDESQDMSATDAFQLIEKRLSESAAVDPQMLNSSPSLESIYHWLKSGIEGFENAKLSHLSAKSHFDQEKVFFEGEGFLNGFYRVLEHLAEPLVRSGRVHLGQQVICIDQRNAKAPVAVHTTARTYFCRRVIVTVPLGVLKRHVIEFRPPLPEPKRQAIEQIGFGKANKTFWEFDQPFWDPQCYGFGYASNTEDRQFHVFINLMPLYGRPVLFCPAVCATAEWVERSSDDEVADAVLRVLSTIFGPERASRQHLKRYTITRWASDEFTGGAYSYFAVGTTEKHVENMAAPFERIYWAGEHTYEDLGYAHGAAISGLREYERIMNELRAERDGAVRALRDARKVSMTASGAARSNAAIHSYFTAAKL